MRQGPDWFPDWKGETIVIVASGPSAAQQSLDAARDRCRFIAVNTSWKLCPWADMLYACDFRWWKSCDGCPDFPGLKVSLDVQASNHPFWGVKHIRCEKNHDRLELDRLGMIGWGSNSGFGALNIAAQLAPKAIILVGYDMTLHSGAHWHGVHPPKLGNPRESQLPRWRRAMEGAAPILAERGISVYNTSPITALKKFRKASFAEALGECFDA